MRVGFIGLGRMGAGMAANLLAAGHELIVYNRTPGKAASLSARGAQVASTIAEACRGDVVITMVANDDALSGIAFGGGGLIAHCRPECTHVSMSTISIELSARLTAAHVAAQQQFVAAPVFGRPDAAAAAKLFIVAAGTRAAVDRCEPLFSNLGQRTFYLGAEPAAANLVKLSGNFLIASVIESLAEALALIGKAGIDQRAYLELLTSTLFNAPVYRNYGALIVEQQYEPAGFAAALGLKDIRLALAAGDALRVPLPLASLLRDRFLALLAQGGEALDWSAIARLAASDAGQGRAGSQ